MICDWKFLRWHLYHIIRVSNIILIKYAYNIKKNLKLIRFFDWYRLKIFNTQTDQLNQIPTPNTVMDKITEVHRTNLPISAILGSINLAKYRLAHS